MKTEVVMSREIMGAEVRQKSKCGLFSANDLHKVGNEYRKNKNLTTKQMQSYFNLDSTKDLINEICIEENITAKEVKISSKGIHGGTWVHPILFVDMVMWYSPSLKVKIIKWVIDGLLSARNDSGNSFKSMNSELTRNFPNEFDSPIAYTKVANQVAAACLVGNDKDKWQKATEEQLKLRDKIQDNVCLLADISTNAGSCLSNAIKKAKKSLGV